MCVFAVSSGLIIHHAALYSVTGGKERRKQLCMHSAHREERTHKNAPNQTKGRKRKGRRGVSFQHFFFLVSHIPLIELLSLLREQTCPVNSVVLRELAHFSVISCITKNGFFYRFLFEFLVLQFQIRIFGGKTPFLVVTYSVRGICSEKDKIPVIVPVG